MEQKSGLRSLYKEIDEDRYQSTEATVGPWSPELQHGGPPSALLFHKLSNVPSDRGWNYTSLLIMKIESLGASKFYCVYSVAM